MAQAENIHQVTPMLHVHDFAEGLDFFTRILGFEITFSMDLYAYLERGGAAIRLLEDKHQSKVCKDKAWVTVYVDVHDVDALFREYEERLSALPVEDVQKPRNQPWNQRDLQVRMPDGNWLTFGQEL